jgi:hypothetical protein
MQFNLYGLLCALGVLCGGLLFGRFLNTSKLPKVSLRPGSKGDKFWYFRTPLKLAFSMNIRLEFEELKANAPLHGIWY